MGPCFTKQEVIMSPFVLLFINPINFLWNRAFLVCFDKLSFTAVNFFRSKNNPTLLHLFMSLGFSEHML